MKKGNFVVVTTEKRGVFSGEFVSGGVKEGCVSLKNARICVYWSADTKGVLGLASTGPATGSKVTKAVPLLDLNFVTSVMLSTPEAKSAWEREPWD